MRAVEGETLMRYHGELVRKLLPGAGMNSSPAAFATRVCAVAGYSPREIRERLRIEDRQIRKYMDEFRRQNARVAQCLKRWQHTGRAAAEINADHIKGLETWQRHWLQKLAATRPW